MAEAAALEAALCAGCDRGGDGAGAETVRRIPLRLRYRRLCGVDARASCPFAGFYLGGGARRRLAAAMGRLHHDALRPQSRTGGAKSGVSAVQAQILALIGTAAFARNRARVARLGRPAARNSAALPRRR